MLWRIPHLGIEIFKWDYENTSKTSGSTLCRYVQPWPPWSQALFRYTRRCRMRYVIWLLRVLLSKEKLYTTKRCTLNTFGASCKDKSTVTPEAEHLKACWIDSIKVQLSTSYSIINTRYKVKEKRKEKEKNYKKKPL